MILKASQRGGSKQLALHLLKTEENEHVHVHELRGFMAEDLQQYFEKQQPYLDPELDLQRVAKECGYSRNQISYLLNQVLGQSFYRYVNQARLQHLMASLGDDSAHARRTWVSALGCDLERCPPGEVNPKIKASSDPKSCKTHCKEESGD